MYLQSLASAWQFRETRTHANSARSHEAEDWLPAQVPGCVHTDLLALGRIPDHSAGDHEPRVQWVAERAWEYRCTFRWSPDAMTVPASGLQAGERFYLVCDGLDTLARVTLNGHPVGQARNMFRRYRWDVTALLLDGENDLRVAFASPLAYIRPRQAERPLQSPDACIPGGPYLRKAACHFGWDWGPQIPPIGIWEDA
jgi:beta-mannosidase